MLICKGKCLKLTTNWLWVQDFESNHFVQNAEGYGCVWVFFPRIVL